MIKKEIAEIKKQFTPDRCSIIRICGCYVDGERNKVSTFKEAFLSLPEEETFKYFEIFRKTLSGSLGKNLLNMEFPIEAEEEGGTQNFLMKLRDSALTDDSLLDEFYNKIIENYYHSGSYLILLIYDNYDIPGRTSDGLEMDDASDEVYKYMLCSVCPVDLEKPGLTYDANKETFVNKIRNWLVGAPGLGFIFPAFNDRSTDIHNVLYYTKSAEEIHEDFIDSILGCKEPLTAGSQKDSFHALIEETLEDSCDLETVKNIHEKLNEIIDENKDEPAPVILDKAEIKTLFGASGVSAEKMEKFDEKFDDELGEKSEVYASNIAALRSFDIKTPDVVVKVNPERMDLVETREIDGKKCLVIEINDDVTVNGINIK